MLQGRYGDTTKSPYVEALLHIPRLGIKSDISFLVDTGADYSVLMPADRERMGINLQSGGFQRAKVKWCVNNSGGDLLPLRDG